MKGPIRFIGIRDLVVLEPGIRDPKEIWERDSGLHLWTGRGIREIVIVKPWDPGFLTAKKKIWNELNFDAYNFTKLVLIKPITFYLKLPNFF